MFVRGSRTAESTILVIIFLLLLPVSVFVNVSVSNLVVLGIGYVFLIDHLK